MEDNGLYKKMNCPICGCSTIDREWEIYECTACKKRWAILRPLDEQKIEVVDQILKEMEIDNIGNQMVRGDESYNCHVLLRKGETIGTVLKNKLY